PGRPARLSIAAILAAQSAGYLIHFYLDFHDLLSWLWLIVYPALILSMGGGSLFAASRLVRYARELHEARAELAALAVGQERIRISRDVHDLIGHTLSVIALRGELALRLLQRSDTGGARREVDGLVTVSRESLRDLYTVTHRLRPLSLADELEG